MIKPIPKPGPKKKPSKTQAEKQHHNRVASLGCIICGGQACIHHVRLNGEPRNHWKVLPLCWDHHQGVEGLHTLGKDEWRRRFGHELDMLAELNQRLRKSA